MLISPSRAELQATSSFVDTSLDDDDFDNEGLFSMEGFSSAHREMRGLDCPGSHLALISGGRRSSCEAYTRTCSLLEERRQGRNGRTPTRM